MKIVLASKSPRRKRILEALGLEFEVDASNADESSIEEGNPKETVMKIAELKAETIAKKHDNALVIAADTVVVFEGEIIGQQENDEDAKEVLKRLVGTTHEVLSGICLISTKNGKKMIDNYASYVTLNNLHDAEIEEYIETGLHRGKAGAYNIDDKGFKCFVERIEGSPSNIIGLPIEKLAKMLKEFGIEVEPDKWDEEWLIKNNLN